jgi:hypothetical protein
MTTPAPSLKSLLPKLARMVGKTPAALYERQRVLVEAGLLQTVAGRGPGSGVRATPQAMATLLIALLASESVTEIGERTAAVMKLKIASGKRCTITGKKTFAEALTAILSSEELAKQIGLIKVIRSSKTAGALIFKKGELFVLDEDLGMHVRKHDALSGFGSRESASQFDGLGIEASLRLPFDQIAHSLTKPENEK